MRNKSFFFQLLPALVFLVVLASGCEKDYVAPATEPSRSFVEEFDTVVNLYAKGWVFNNNSRPQGTATWRQGIFASGLFGLDGWPAFSYKYSANEYAFAGFSSGRGISTLSSWMITPEIEMRNGDRFSFYTRTFTGSIYPDRLQVRLNPTDNSADVGFDSSTVGKFTALLADINPGLTVAGYPQVWTRYEYMIAGLTSTLSKRRISFRYYVPNGGAGANSNGIGIDKFDFISQ